MSYVDGFVGAVPIANKDAYTRLASISADVFRECGALGVIEAWGDDLPEGKINSMHTAVLRKPDETVIFSWIVWPDKAARDAGMAKAMQDPRMQMTPAAMPFDGKRMIWSGFQVIVER